MFFFRRRGSAGIKCTVSPCTTVRKKIKNPTERARVDENKILFFAITRDPGERRNVLRGAADPIFKIIPRLPAPPRGADFAPATADRSERDYIFRRFFFSFYISTPDFSTLCIYMHLRSTTATARSLSGRRFRIDHYRTHSNTRTVIDCNINDIEFDYGMIIIMISLSKD